MRAAEVKAVRQLANRIGDSTPLVVGNSSLIARKRIVIPLWVSLVQGLIGGLWRAAGRFIRLVLSYPVISAFLIDALITYLHAGWAGVLVQVVVVLIVALIWARVWPDSWQYRVVVPSRSWWRWQRIYRARWRDLMVGCGLLDVIDDHEIMTQIVTLRSHPGHDEIVLALAPGQVPDDVISSCEALTHGLGAWQVQGRNMERGRVALVVLWSDPLISTIRPAVEPGSPDDDPDPEPGEEATVPQLVTAETVLTRLASVAVGSEENTAPWLLCLLPGRHTLISGTTGAGKSGLLWAILWSLRDLILLGWIRITALDPKFIELRQITDAGLGEVVVKVPAIVERLEQLVIEMDTRCDRMTSRKWRPGKANPFRIIIIDELATLTALTDSSSKKRVEQAMGALMSRGRAAGFLVIITSVEATKDVVRWRALCANRICYATDDKEVDLTLGEGAHDAGARTEEISMDTPGVAFVRVRGRRGITRVRTWEITDDHIESLISNNAHQDSQQNDQKITKAA